MSSIGKFSTKLSVAIMSIMLSMSCTMANTLTEIEINTVDNGYGVVLKTDEVAQMKKTITSDNRMVIELKDVELSSDLNTIYNDVSDIDNVTVLPLAKNGIKIVLKGNNVANTKVSFGQNFSPVSAIQSTTQSIELSAPMSSYTPVYTPDMFEEPSEPSQTSNPELNAILTKMHVSREMLLTVKKYAKKIVNKTKSADINMITMLGMFLIAIALIFRPSKKQNVKVSKEKVQTLSGLIPNSSRTLQMDREIALNKNMLASMDLSKSTGSNNTAVNVGYGMKAYQQSQKNPYSTSVQTSNGVSGIAMRKPFPTTPIKKQTTTNKPISKNTNVPIKSKAPSLVSPAIKKQSLSTASAPQADIDSMKFLESITKIYEKNGRADLAKGLQDNLKKAQMSQKLAI